MGRVASARSLFSTDLDDQRAVDREQRYRRPTCCSTCDGNFTVPLEVVCPHLSSWIENGYHCTGFRVDGISLRPLSQRAGDTGQGKVVLSGRTGECSRDHVINVKGSLLPDLRKPTILTTVSRALNDAGSQARRNVAHGAFRSFRRRSKVRNSATFTSPSASSRSCGVSVWPES